MPKGLDRRTAAGRAWIESSHGDALTWRQGQIGAAVVESIRSNAEAMALLEGAEVERVMTWEIDDVPCKGRVDAVRRNILADLKTTRELATFERSFVDFKYHGQFAFYGDGAIISDVCDQSMETYVIAAETSEPYDSAVYRIPDPVLDLGRELYRDLLALWKQCERTGCWPGRSPAVRDIEIPRWAWGKEEEGF